MTGYPSIGFEARRPRRSACLLYSSHSDTRYTGNFPPSLCTTSYISGPTIDTSVPRDNTSKETLAWPKSVKLVVTDKSSCNAGNAKKNSKNSARGRQRPIAHGATGTPSLQLSSLARSPPRIQSDANLLLFMSGHTTGTEKCHSSRASGCRRGD